jgi:hypothetical protein
MKKPLLLIEMKVIEKLMKYQNLWFRDCKKKFDFHWIQT